MISPADPRRWPALAGWDAAASTIRCQRALRGKVHRARTDYRWIAVSQGWEPGGDLLERITLGWEDEPKSLTAWTPVGGGFAAICAYPSPARDADGRPGGLEKQILTWQPNEPNSVPLLAAAFAMIRAGGSYPNSLQAGYWRGEQWADSAFHELLPAEEVIPLGALAADLAQGLAEVRSTVAQEDLASFYQNVQDGIRPAFCPAPLSAAGWLALWLPWEPSHLQSLSWLSDPPTARLDREKLARWTATYWSAAARSSGPGPEARALAELLWNGPRQAAPPVKVADALEIAQFEASVDVRPPAPVQGTLLAQLRLFLQRPARRIAPPPPGTCSEAEGLEMARAILAFETQLRQEPPAPNEIARARQLHLQAKAELARAWVYQVAPFTSVVDAIPPHQNRLVRSTYFAGNHPSTQG